MAIENSSLKKKAELRKWALSLLETKDPRILDAYCAKGEMWQHAYDCTKNYLGIDINYCRDEREKIFGDNTRVLRQIDLESFDVFDLDAFGTPFECFKIICQRLKWSQKNEVVFVLTDGTGYNFKMGSVSKGLLEWLGLAEAPRIRSPLDYRDDIIRTAIDKGVREAHGAIEGEIRVMYKDRGSYMRYVAFKVKKKGV